MNLCTGEKIRVSLLSMIILVSGIVTGSAGTLILIRQKPVPAPGGIEFVRERMLERIGEDLSLTEAQQEKIRTVMKESFDKLDKIRKQARPEIAKIMNGMNEQVLEVLDDEQKQLWRGKMNELARRFRNKPRDKRQGKRRMGRQGRPFDFWRQQMHGSEDHNNIDRGARLPLPAEKGLMEDGQAGPPAAPPPPPGDEIGDDLLFPSRQDDN